MQWQNMTPLPQPLSEDAFPSGEGMEAGRVPEQFYRHAPAALCSEVLWGLKDGISSELEQVTGWAVQHSYMQHRSR